jgi:uncharacterized protein (TIGR03435 family)
MVARAARFGIGPGARTQGIAGENDSMRVFTGISLVAILSSLAFGQSNGTSPKFDVADVHPSARAANPYTYLSGGVLRGGRYDLHKATMLDLVRIAYGVDPDKVLGGPNWLELDRFDVDAKAPPDTPPETVKLMLQALLAERFKLALHNDTRPMPAFTLTAGKGKPKLREAEGSGESGCQSPPQPGYSTMTCRNLTMEAFAQTLRGRAGDYLTIPVVDSTGLKGSWDFDLRWNSRSQSMPAGAERVTIFEAIDKQLGLTLELQKAPAPVLVVDRANEKPSANPPGTAQALPPRPLEFDVAAIKPSRPDEPGFFRTYPSGRFEWRGMPMKILISTAWDVDWDHIDEVLAGAPKWIDSRRFDITATTAPAPEAPAGSGFIDDDMRLMIRALLIDRFKIATHSEDRPVPAYTLVAVKPKLKKADPSNRSRCKEAGVVANDPRDANPRLSRLLTCQNVTMAQFAKQLQGLEAGDFPNEVADATGIDGAWDFTLNYTPSYLLRGGGDAGPPAGGAAMAPDPNGGISIFDAVNKQLGLRLEMRKRMLPVLVIDHMEDKPTDN